MPRAARYLAVAAAITAGVVDGLYLLVIRSQPSDGPGNPQITRVQFVATFIAVLAIAAAWSTRQSAARWRPALLGLSAIGLLGLGSVAIFSIGLPLIVAGAMALGALIVTLAHSAKPGALLRAGAGAICALVLFVGGFELADPAGMCLDLFHDSCANGKLILAPGGCTRTAAIVDPSGHVATVTDC